MEQSRIQNSFFFLLLALVTLAFTGLIWDFMMPIFWAAVLAVLFRPLQRKWVENLKGRKSAAAVITLVTIILLVILPLFLMGFAVSREAASLYQRISEGDIDLEQLVARFRPLILDYLGGLGVDVEGLQQRIAGAAVGLSQLIASQALEIGQNALRITALFGLMLYILFFFLRDGEEILDAIIRALPIGDARERGLFGKFAEVTRATLKGNLVVGVVQGSLGGLAFWFLGIGAPVFWGVIMAILSLLPAVGTVLVWLPAAIILMVTGEITRGIILIIFGSVVIGLVDNILRPILVGRDTRMPDYMILLSTLGGLAAFGLSGFVIGPVIAAFFLAVWKMFEQEFAVREDPESFQRTESDPAPTHRSPSELD